MYAELLKKASNRSEVELVHPRFVSTLSELSPQEAQLLELIRTNAESTIPFIACEFRKRHEILMPDWEYYPVYWSSLHKMPNRQLHLTNLQSLGLLHRSIRSWRSPDESLYDEVESSLNRDRQHLDLCKLYSQDNALTTSQPVYIRGFYALTPYGQIFVEAVTESH